MAYDEQLAERVRLTLAGRDACQRDHVIAQRLGAALEDGPVLPPSCGDASPSLALLSFVQLWIESRRAHSSSLCNRFIPVYCR